jgi:hypothetical protein
MASPDSWRECFRILSRIQTGPIVFKVLSKTLASHIFDCFVHQPELWISGPYSEGIQFPDGKSHSDEPSG